MVRCRHRPPWERKRWDGDTRRQRLHELWARTWALWPGTQASHQTGGGRWARGLGYVGTPGTSLTQDHLLTGRCAQAATGHCYPQRKEGVASSLCCPSQAPAGRKGWVWGPTLWTMGTLGLTSIPGHRDRPFPVHRQTTSNPSPGEGHPAFVTLSGADVRTGP